MSAVLSSAFKRRSDLYTHFGVRDTCICNWILDGIFPPPIKMGLRATAWLDSEVAAITAAMAAGQTKTELRALVIRLIADRKALPARVAASLTATGGSSSRPGIPVRARQVNRKAS